ncbi:MAG: hypothetical protein IKS52_00045, partial [Clostridia bacterium]|nr:hypothetical protein [Clostridia bacterium]
YGGAQVDMAVPEADGAYEANDATMEGAEAKAMNRAVAEIGEMDLADEEAFEADVAEDALETMGAEDLFDAEATSEPAPMCAAAAQLSPACEMTIESKGVATACDVIRDLADEFEGTADVQNVEGGSANVYVEMDARYAGEFLSSVAKLDDSQNPPEVPSFADEGQVRMLLVIRPAE